MYKLITILLFLSCITGHGQVLTEEELNNAEEFVWLQGALNEPEKVFRFKLSGKEYSEFPLDILKLRNLNELMIQNTDFSSIPEEISELKYLTKITFYSNQNLQSLPKGISKLIELRHLSVWNCPVSEIPDMSNLKKMSWLDLRLTNIKVFPTSICQLENLEHLAIAGYGGFQDEDAGRIIPLAFIPAEIGQLTHLNEVNFSYSQITELPDEIKNCQELFFVNIAVTKINHIPNCLKQIVKEREEGLEMKCSDGQITSKNDLKYLKNHGGKKEFGEKNEDVNLGPSLFYTIQINPDI